MDQCCSDLIVWLEQYWQCVSFLVMKNMAFQSSLPVAFVTAVMMATVDVQAHPPFVSTYPDSYEDYICGRESQSAGGCFTHWCMSYDLKIGPIKPSEKEEAILLKYGFTHSAWSPCYVLEGELGGADVNQGGVGWWGWESGRLGSSSLDGFWVRDYRQDKERDSCGMNCTRYGFAGRIKGNPDCYHVREGWKNASLSDLPSDSSKPVDGWLDRVYCMRAMVAD